MMRMITLIVIMSLLFACKKKSSINEVFALREMSELATVEYMVTKIIRASDDQTWYKIGDRKILMSCEASVKAGIDMSAIKEENISIDGKSISPCVWSLSSMPRSCISVVSLPIWYRVLT